MVCTTAILLHVNGCRAMTTERLIATKSTKTFDKSSHSNVNSYDRTSQVPDTLRLDYSPRQDLVTALYGLPHLNTNAAISGGVASDFMQFGLSGINPCPYHRPIVSTVLGFSLYIPFCLGLDRVSNKVCQQYQARKSLGLQRLEAKYKVRGCVFSHTTVYCSLLHYYY